MKKFAVCIWDKTLSFGSFLYKNSKKIYRVVAGVKKIHTFAPHLAGVAELVDVPDLGSGALRRGGSSPFARTAEITALLNLKTGKQAVFINYKH